MEGEGCQERHRNRSSLETGTPAQHVVVKMREGGPRGLKGDKRLWTR